MYILIKGLIRDLLFSGFFGMCNYDVYLFFCFCFFVCLFFVFCLFMAILVAFPRLGVKLEL